MTPRNETPEERERRLASLREYNRNRRPPMSPEAKARHIEKTLEARKGHKRAAIAALGGRCEACHEDDLAALTVDHIEGGGTAERKNLQATTLWRLIAEGERRAGLRCLCFSCNHRARADVYGPDISAWPADVLDELAAIKMLRRERKGERMEFTSKEKAVLNLLEWIDAVVPPQVEIIREAA